jgi:hypothetical protein
MNTAVDVSKLKTSLHRVKLLNCAQVCVGGHGQLLAFPSKVHEQTQSIRTWNIFKFATLDFIICFYFSLYLFEHSCLHQYHCLHKFLKACRI